MEPATPAQAARRATAPEASPSTATATTSDRQGADDLKRLLPRYLVAAAKEQMRPAKAPKMSTPRRERTLWMPAEDQALMDGVEKYRHERGIRWSAIKRDPELGCVLSNRTQVDLKDRFRNLAKAKGREWQGMRGGAGVHGVIRKGVEAFFEPYLQLPAAGGDEAAAQV